VKALGRARVHETRFSSPEGHGQIRPGARRGGGQARENTTFHDNLLKVDDQANENRSPYFH
jgi:hypothetical protein